MIYFVMLHAMIVIGLSFVLAQPVAVLLNTILAGFLVKTTVTFVMSWSALLVVGAASMILGIPATILIGWSRQ